MCNSLCVSWYAIFFLVHVECTTHTHTYTHTYTLSHICTHAHKYGFHCRIYMAKAAKLQYCSWLFQKKKNTKHISQFFDVLWHWFCAMMVFLLPGLDLSITCHVVFFPHSLSCVCVLYFVRLVFISISNDFAGTRRCWCVWMYELLHNACPSTYV